ncbi:hypothetical protein CEUSTIGMA_g1787.t1 [Chlamydomonas eustigma]|uniref:RBR-type E3 ubiquitin transferase n=1 Tax=Chlamydomonas eustigma TaxID=1157962 RepID=A0A250WU35_9CHLO|nr:hypothetical protein CEUSTIGMA_g1787.t1 [Chlamydomonas eustigma]|eukprot:GAX74338.1 hypothetical protein CEUSTIGMA_g1787.t1 [Chlamydomonas eustigma]
MSLDSCESRCLQREIMDEDSDGYNYNSGDDEMQDSSEEGGSGSDEDFGYDASAEIEINTKKVAYKVLSKQDLKKRQDETVTDVINVLGISNDEATRVLRKFKWDISRVHEAWFSDVDSVRAAVGIQEESSNRPTSSSEELCMICFEPFPISSMRASACGHSFCPPCWRGYISTAVSSGPAALDLRCPVPKCGSCVPTALVREILEPEDLGKYETFALRSFVEDNKRMSWCPGKGCESTVECLVDRAADEPLDVLCNCSTAFCFSCKEEAHRPVSCEVVRKWITKNSAESENLNWILANTKPCPKCHRPIEKNQGCMHMVCSQCKFEFCWLCQGDWKEHGERTGGYYNCNRFETAKRKGELDDETKRRENAKHSLERYMHYFERWDAHHKARDKAISDAGRVSTDSLEKLSDMTKTPTSQLKFIMDAWHQIIECRRILSWTYCFGYYQFMEVAEADDLAAASAAAAAKSSVTNKVVGSSSSRTVAATASAKAGLKAAQAAAAAEAKSDAARAAALEPQQRQRHFFEFLQGDAERSLDRLHEAAEKQLQEIVHDSSRNFQEFRKNLIGLTDVTQQFFDKLVKQLERGFESMQDEYMVTQSPQHHHPQHYGGDGSSGTSSHFNHQEPLQVNATSSAVSLEGAQGGSRMSTTREAAGGAAAAASRSSQSGGSAAAAAGPAAGSGLLSSHKVNTRRSSKRGRGLNAAAAGGGGVVSSSVLVGCSEGGEEEEEEEDVNMEPEELLRQQGFWSCTHCTYNNDDLTLEQCEVCAHPRQHHN